MAAFVLVLGPLLLLVVVVGAGWRALAARRLRQRLGSCAVRLPAFGQPVTLRGRLLGTVDAHGAPSESLAVQHPEGRIACSGAVRLCLGRAPGQGLLPGDPVLVRGALVPSAQGYRGQPGLALTSAELAYARTPRPGPRSWRALLAVTIAAVLAGQVIALALQPAPKPARPLAATLEERDWRTVLREARERGACVVDLLLEHGQITDAVAEARLCGSREDLERAEYYDGKAPPLPRWPDAPATTADPDMPLGRPFSRADRQRLGALLAGKRKTPELVLLSARALLDDWATGDHQLSDLVNRSTLAGPQIAVGTPDSRPLSARPLGRGASRTTVLADLGGVSSWVEAKRREHDPDRDHWLPYGCSSAPEHDCLVRGDPATVTALLSVSPYCRHDALIWGGEPVEVVVEWFATRAPPAGPWPHPLDLCLYDREQRRIMMWAERAEDAATWSRRAHAHCAMADGAQDLVVVEVGW